ncbi:MAG TPA: 16S rRNA (adenine(1518)-N(6)/adenine(1519)-N(6))-dimethyltransferase RsmA [Candidatus Paceibacterota bacterium]|nr:16S rRNA (adenine(1518)-N(6)/adenine(1519)-N(6))-dimethyltransferase RsmA [Candidatus Paceibacterota bacterium]
MQKLGQHFLKNAAVLEKIVGALALADGERVIEIGAGHGELTAPLALAARKCNGTIISIEKDYALISALTELSQKETPGLLSIIEGDALKLLPEIVAAEVLSAKEPRYKIVGNIPYYITGKLLRTISELEYKPERTVLLVQKEVAERICAAPPAMNRLAASVQFWADAAVVATVPKKDFSPPPEVDSAIVVLKTKSSTGKSMVTPPAIEPALYYRAVRSIFAQPRKTLLNNLSVITGSGTPKDKLAEQLKEIGVDPAARPQDLNVEQITAIAKAPLWG